MAGADLLRRARRDAGLSQETLARRAGTSRATLSAYEHGHESPTLATAERVELVVEAGVGDWAQARGVNGWRGWVDGRLLYRR